ncbi:hypothetical protein J6590_028365 [Homalodisca vitripennis]|nr:hypothetical protein J6590_028365 [Homalodisca vitripennis]
MFTVVNPPSHLVLLWDCARERINLLQIGLKLPKPRIVHKTRNSRGWKYQSVELIEAGLLRPVSPKGWELPQRSVNRMKRSGVSRRNLLYNGKSHKQGCVRDINICKS